MTDIDLTPITLATLRIGAKTLAISPPLRLTPNLDDSQLLNVELEELGIDAHGFTRESLLIELSEQIGMLWQEYALAEDDSLDSVSLRRKQALLARIKEIGASIMTGTNAGAACTAGTAGPFCGIQR